MNCTDAINQLCQAGYKLAGVEIPGVGLMCVIRRRSKGSRAKTSSSVTRRRTRTWDGLTALAAGDDAHSDEITAFVQA